ncbi:MAG TPA: hypothetical protein VN698_11705 [Bacteroidia bacterium]|nr:hypothetical protein [Bacteroidia bacterium]
MKHKILSFGYFCFAITVMLFNSSCYNYAKPEIFLVPKGFNGRLEVVFNQKNGTPVKYENEQRIYQIPNDGILLTQFSDDYGIINHKFYYVDSIGNRTPIPIFAEEHNPDGTTKWLFKDENEIGVFLDGTTGQHAEGNKAPFLMVVISNYKTMDSFFTKEYKTKFEERLKERTGLNISIP